MGEGADLAGDGVRGGGTRSTYRLLPTAEFVAELEKRYDEESEFLDTTELMDEVEQFLRDLPAGGADD